MNARSGAGGGAGCGRVILRTRRCLPARTWCCGWLGMGLRIWLANALGGEGMGLYQLVLAVYGLFVTLATAGISVAATRLHDRGAQARIQPLRAGCCARLVLAGLTLGGLAMVAQLATAGLAAKWWLGDVRAAAALRTSALGLPWMAVSAVLRGFFLARRRVEPNVLSQLAEQTVRIAAVVCGAYAARRAGRCGSALYAGAGLPPPSARPCQHRPDGTVLPAGGRQRCLARAQRRRPPGRLSRRLWDILWPVEGGRVLVQRSAHRREYAGARLPCGLSESSGGRTAALEQYGTLKGMALPLLTFPFGLLGSLAVLLMPEITQAHILGQTDRLNALLDRMLRLTGYFSALAGALFWVWGRPLAQLLYHSAGGRVLSGDPCPGHAADVSGKHGGRCHEGRRGAEGRLPATACGTPCCALAGWWCCCPASGCGAFWR
ncbi:MAG: oligosaccharide flippase family protein [Faecalibacterium prausnitzii]